MKVKNMTLIALLMAMTTIITMYISFPIFQGYLNLGDVIVMSMGLLIPLNLVFLAGVGAALADLLLGYGQYAFFTLVIKTIEAYIIGKWAVKHSDKKVPIHIFLTAGIWMAFAYGLTDIILTQNPLIFFTSFGYNSLQGIVCALIAFMLVPILKKIKNRQ